MVFRKIEPDIVSMIVTFSVFAVAVILFVIFMTGHRCNKSHFYRAYSSKIGSYKGWDCDKREWTTSKPDQDFMSMQQLEKIGTDMK
jgi:hypothetical protein